MTPSLTIVYLYVDIMLGVGSISDVEVFGGGAKVFSHPVLLDIYFLVAVRYKAIPHRYRLESPVYLFGQGN